MQSICHDSSSAGVKRIMITEHGLAFATPLTRCNALIGYFRLLVDERWSKHDQQHRIALLLSFGRALPLCALTESMRLCPMNDVQAQRHLCAPKDSIALPTLCQIEYHCVILGFFRVLKA